MTNKTIAIIGKSTVSPHSSAYRFTKELSYQLVMKGFKIRHGGYDGGIMQAASEGALLAIKENSLPQDFNTGVPELRFDTDYKRTPGSKFLKSSRNITARLNNLILKSDYVIASPRGGDGTMLELQLAIHENMLGKYTRTIRPIIICELPGETLWTKIMNTQLKLLDNPINNIHDCPWIFIVHSIKQAIDAII